MKRKSKTIVWSVSEQKIINALDCCGIEPTPRAVGQACRAVQAHLKSIDLAIILADAINGGLIQ